MTNEPSLSTEQRNLSILLRPLRHTSSTQQVTHLLSIPQACAENRCLISDHSQSIKELTFEALTECPENPLKLEHEVVCRAEYVKQMKRGSANRRRRSAHRGPSAHDIQHAHLREFHKSEFECECLLKALKQSQFFRFVSDEELRNLCRYFYPVVYKKDDPIIVQNDVGKTFYVIEKGKVDIFKIVPKEARPRQRVPRDHPIYGQYITTLAENDYFGEIAILLKCKRTASCISASSVVKLWALDSDAFHKISVHMKDAQFSANLALFRRMDLFNVIPAQHLENIVRNIKIISFKPGQPIVVQGEVGNYFYIILKGKVRVMKNGIMVAIVREGSYFGELALLEEESRRNATVIAMRDVKCGVLTRQCFHASIYALAEKILLTRMMAYSDPDSNNSSD